MQQGVLSTPRSSCLRLTTPTGSWAALPPCCASRALSLAACTQARAAGLKAAWVAAAMVLRPLLGPEGLVLVGAQARDRGAMLDKRT